MEVGEQSADNDCRAACCILSKHPFVDFEAVRQSIHEPEDAYPDFQDCADLPQRVILLFSTWQESFATRSGSTRFMTRSGPGSPAVSEEPRSPFRQRVDQTGLTCGELIARVPRQTKFGKMP